MTDACSVERHGSVLFTRQVFVTTFKSRKLRNRDAIPVLGQGDVVTASQIQGAAADVCQNTSGVVANKGNRVLHGVGMLGVPVGRTNHVRIRSVGNGTGFYVVDRHTLI